MDKIGKNVTIISQIFGVFITWIQGEKSWNKKNRHAGKKSNASGKLVKM